MGHVSSVRRKDAVLTVDTVVRYCVFQQEGWYMR